MSGSATELGEQQLSAPEFTFRPYKVSEVGQLSLPAQVRRSFGVIDGGYIEACYFDQALLVVPLGKSEDLIDAVFPYVQPHTRPSSPEKIAELKAWFDGDRSKQVRWTSVTDEVAATGDPSIKRVQAMSEAFKPYKVSQVGQFTLPAGARRAWELEEGGTIGIYTFDSFAVLVPNGETAPVDAINELRKLIPLDTLLTSGETHSGDKHSRDLEAYKQWAGRVGSAVVGMAESFVDAETALGDTPFRKHLIEAAVRDVMEAAYRQVND